MNRVERARNLRKNQTDAENYYGNIYDDARLMDGDFVANILSAITLWTSFALKRD